MQQAWTFPGWDGILTSENSEKARRLARARISAKADTGLRSEDTQILG